MDSSQTATTLKKAPAASCESGSCPRQLRTTELNSRRTRAASQLAPMPGRRRGDVRPCSRMRPSVIGGPGGCVGFIYSSAPGSRIGAGSGSSSSTCPVPLQSGQSSPSPIQPRPLQCRQTFIANNLHVAHGDQVLPNVRGGFLFRLERGHIPRGIFTNPANSCPARSLCLR